LKPEAQNSRAPSPEEISDNKEPRTKEKDKLKAVNALKEPLVPTQLKIMYITPSLINFHSRVLCLIGGEKKTIATESLATLL
jgi:hypothetical protein